jgi:hypothetical protein
MVGANYDDIVYEITFNLPNAGLSPENLVLVDTPYIAGETCEYPTDAVSTEQMQYPTQLLRSEIGHQP